MFSLGLARSVVSYKTDRETAAVDQGYCRLIIVIRIVGARKDGETLLGESNLEATCTHRMRPNVEYEIVVTHKVLELILVKSVDLFSRW